jgi:Bacterial Ig-like domain (group 3)/FG-GAP-like repeat
MRTHTQLLRKFLVRLLILLTTLAQVMGAGQSKKPSVAAALPDARTSTQMLRASVSRSRNTENFPLGFPSQQFRSGAMVPGGLFLPAVKYGSGGTAPFSVSIADVNGDGRPDIVVANLCESLDCSSSEGGVAVLLGNGDGTFQSAVSYSSGGIGAQSVAIADVNSDGRPDLLVGTCATGSLNCDFGQTGEVAVLLGNGDGTFQPATTYASGGWGADSVAVADVNGDGKPDLLVTNFYDPTKGLGSVGVLLGNGDGIFQPVVTYASNWSNVYSVVVADVNGDGKPDLLLAGDVVIVLLGNGDGTFQPAKIYGRLANTISLAIAVADVNGDGKLDVVAANFDVCGNCASTVGVLLGNGDGSFRSPVTYDSGGVFADSLAVVDVDGDGKPDVVVANCGPKGQSGCDAFTNGVVGVLLGNGDGTFQPVVTFDAGGPNVEALAAGDLRRTGRPDLVTTSFFQANIVGVLLNNTAVKSSTSTTLTSSLNPSLYGQKVTWTATVTSSGSITPTGKVNFTWDGYSIGSATLNASGVATLTKSNLNADPYPLTAVFTGDVNNLRSTSAIVNQVVTETTSTAKITSTPNPSTLGQAVTFTATVTSPTVIPTGPVTFMVGTKVLGTAQLGSGKATFTTSTLPVGSTKVTAIYYGDSNIAKSSASVVQTVQ